MTINRPPRDGHMAFVRSPDNVSIELLQIGDGAAAGGALGEHAEHRDLVSAGAARPRRAGGGRARAARRRGAAAAACRLALSLGLDVSSSVDAREYRLQTEGLAAALTAPEVREAFLATPGAPVMLQIYEWSGWQQQVVRVAVDGDRRRGRPRGDRRRPRRPAAQLRAVSDRPRPGAAASAATALAGQDCTKRTLDLSGDGTNNDGISPEVARRELAMPGITVNGLVIGANVETLGRYYQQFVIQGPGAFVEVAADYEDFERAMRRKLLRELGVIEMSGEPEGVTGQ